MAMPPTASRRRMELLPCEDVEEKALGVALMRGGASTECAVYVTNFRVVISETGGDGEIISIPIARVATLEDKGKTDGGSTSLLLELKDLREFHFVFPAGHAKGSHAIFAAIDGRWSAPSYSGSFAFAANFRGQLEAGFPTCPHRGEAAAAEQTQWHALDVHADFARLGVPNRHWRISQANAVYELCPSYPPLLAVPTVMSDEEMAQVGSFRERRRVPILCWRHVHNGAALCRCAQPMYKHVYIHVLGMCNVHVCYFLGPE